MDNRKGIMALLAVMAMVLAVPMALQADTDGSSPGSGAVSASYEGGTVIYSVDMDADYAFLQVRDDADGIVYLGPRADSADGSVTGSFKKELEPGVYKLWVQDSDGDVAQCAFTVAGPAPVHSIDVRSVSYNDGVVTYSVETDLSYAFLQVRDEDGAIVYLGPRIDASDGSMEGSFRKTLASGGYSLWAIGGGSDVSDGMAFEVASTIHPTGVELDRDVLEMAVGDVSTLACTVTPGNANDTSVTWSSSDASVASVDADGKVTALKAGTATITVATVDGGFTAKCVVSVVVPATGVTLDRTSVEVPVGGSTVLTATVAPSDATEPSVTWSSSDASVASVDADGRVTAKKPGKAVITATTVDGGFTAECEVAVVIPVTSIVIDGDLVRLQIGGETILAATVEPANAHYRNLVWTSSDESVATVEDGVVKAVGRGVAVISVHAEGWGPVAECTVTVIAPATDVEVDTEVSDGVAVVDPDDVSDAISDAGDAPVNVVVNVVDDSVKEAVIDEGIIDAMVGANASVTIRTSNGTITLDPEALASVAGAGEISITMDPEPELTKDQTDFVGQDHETFRITVSANGENRSTFGNGMLDVFLPYDMDGRDERYVGFYHVADSGDYEPVDFDFVEGGITATLRHLSVYSIVYDEEVAVTGVELNKSSTTLVVGGAETLIENVLPAKAADRGVAWSSSDPSVASVDFKGRIVALKAGTSTITVTTTEGGFTASCKVVVTSPVVDIPVTGVKIDRDSASMTEGGRITLKATVSPSGATVYGVVWSSSDPSVASVDQSGNVTAKKSGTAVITVTTMDGGFKDTCEITVESESSGSSDNTMILAGVAILVVVTSAVLVFVMIRRN